MTALPIRPALAGALLGVYLCLPAPSLHAQPDFGDNSSRWANDGECDDPRFEGEGSAATLLDGDRGHDATDCRTLFNAGKIALRRPTTATRDTVDFGDDSSEWARDGECDDPRFEGDGVAETLLDADAYHDATDCRALFGRGRIALRAGRAELATRLERNGRLQSGDDTLKTGEFVDSYEFEGSSGQHVAIDLRSSAFDTYLILKDPAGEQTENDDAEDGSGVGHSNIEADLTENGTYRVLVTSYESGESGAYSLTIDPSAAGTGSPRSRDVTLLTVGAPVGGELIDGDLMFEAGEYHDTYVFDGDEGDAVRIALESGDFDTYLGLITPSGEEIANDDFEGDTERSVIELALPESGRYRVQATSYAAAETGRYRLALTTSTTDVPVERRSQGRVYGLFAGISNYEPPSTDLAYTAEDATRIRDALIGGGGMRAADAVTFLDSDATIGNVTAAIRDIAARMQPADTFVMFYSGHGGQVPRNGPTASDPDALDETLTLYDGSLLDDELRELFDEIDQGTVLLWLDSCFSGGFAKDIVSAPGRMGIFSSEEDITSNVASKFRAGGYLSHFLDEAIAQGFADDDKDNAITALELSQYLHERYRADVKSARPVEVVRNDMTLGYQHLVVDRGSVGAYDVLFER